MNDKIKLEDMTLAQIREAKDTLRDNIKSAVEEAVNDFYKSYDVGDIKIKLEREPVYEKFEFTDGSYEKLLHHINYHIYIQFSKENE